MAYEGLKVEYYIHKHGDLWFQPSNLNVDASHSALDQCVRLSPDGTAIVPGEVLNREGAEEEEE